MLRLPKDRMAIPLDRMRQARIVATVDAGESDRTISCELGVTAAQIDSHRLRFGRQPGRAETAMDEVRTGEGGARMVFQSREARTDNGNAKAIIAAERKARDEKTARLRAARLEQAASLKV